MGSARGVARRLGVGLLRPQSLSPAPLDDDPGEQSVSSSHRYGASTITTPCRGTSSGGETEDEADVRPEQHLETRPGDRGPRLVVIGEAARTDPRGGAGVAPNWC
jgi:hypothetical protein